MLLWPLSSSETTKSGITIKDAVITIYMVTAWLGSSAAELAGASTAKEMYSTNNAFMIKKISRFYFITSSDNRT
jgi:hypothetical protein